MGKMRPKHSVAAMTPTWIARNPVARVLALLAALHGGGLLAQENTPLFDIPRLNNIIIDGRADDWGDAGFAVEVMASVDGRIMPRSDMDSRLSLGWNDRGLLVLIRATDQSFVEAEKADALYEGDCVELYLADRR